MKLYILVCFLILSSLTGFGNSQETYSNKLDSVQHYKLDLDSIGAALIKGIEYRKLYYNEQLLTKVLKYQIDLWKEKDANKEITIQKLITELSTKPTFISSHDWKITILISGLTAILTIITTLQLTK